jgi:hypothetical protein
MKLFAIVFFAVLLAGGTLLGLHNYQQKKERERIAQEVTTAQIKRLEERKKRADEARVKIEAEIVAENAKIDALLKQPVRK